MRAYISVSYHMRKLLDQEIKSIMEVLRGYSISPLVFVDQYKFESEQERDMMKTALSEIESCDLLIAEVSDKGIGIGVEVGYAKAKGKPVLYLRQRNADHSTTVSGISDFHIAYSDTMDLKQKLSKILNKLKGELPTFIGSDNK
ncbi:MAG TPA: nucleoside 2-deoxyribosyltransferase [Cyclobacteriaceae bacterium]|nr:nucleoside 2-deoxyribosyltransferase [Cyclobacteriaceae bacterium]